jgi:hypothetical protein
MCVPIGAVLHVLNYTHVDFISLDTESTEPHILVGVNLLGFNIGFTNTFAIKIPIMETLQVGFPWASVTVDVWMIERGGDAKNTFIQMYFTLMGYSKARHNGQDDFYVRNDFKY